MNRFRRVVIAVTVALPFTAATWVLAGVFFMSGDGPSFSPDAVHAQDEDVSTYDTDCDGLISRDEVLGAISAYFQGEITRDLVLTLIGLYFAQTPLVHPTGSSCAPTPAPTPIQIPITDTNRQYGKQENIKVNDLFWPDSEPNRNCIG